MISVAQVRAARTGLRPSATVAAKKSKERSPAVALDKSTLPLTPSLGFPLTTYEKQ